MDKFGRNYVLEIEISDGGDSIEITPPLTMEFDVTRNTLTSANVAQFRVFNLSETRRNQIRKNIYNYGVYREVSLRAGYQNDLSTTFIGNITQAFSAREGCNMVTTIQCLDGGFAFANGEIQIPFSSGTPYRNMLDYLAGSLPNVKKGTIGDYAGDIQRGNSFSGSTCNLLSELSGQGFFIDNCTAHCLKTNECLRGDLLVISPASGLLGTPIIEETLLTLDLIFEPRIFAGQFVDVQSFTDQKMNGPWKVTGIKHRGMISSAICGDLITSLQLSKGDGVLEIIE